MTIDLDVLRERLEDAAERVPAVPPERHVHLDLLVRRVERFLDACTPSTATSTPTRRGDQVDRIRSASDFVHDRDRTDPA